MSLQVQLLISAQDVENYKVIKSELDKLRTMVEKSELWVDKKGSTKGDSTGDGNKKEKKEVRAMSKTLRSRLGKEWEAGGQLTLIQHLMPLNGEAPGGSCGVWLEGHSVTPVLLCPLQHGADEEVIAPGEKSSENYQIVKGVSETKPWCTGRKERGEILGGFPSSLVLQ